MTARFGGSSGDEWYGGKVMSCRHVGAKPGEDPAVAWVYEIDYDDGDHEDDLEGTWVRPKDGEAGRMQQQQQQRQEQQTVSQ